MCGKFTQYSRRQMQVFIDVLRTLLEITEADPLETVTPMRFASVLMLDESRRRRMTPMRWGFSRRSADAPGNKPDHIHARCETIDSKPTFREAFAARRGLLIVRSFDEGKEIALGKTQQYTITPNDGQPMAIAVLWEKWESQNGGALYTFVMVTTPPNRLTGAISDRMPAIISPGDWRKWLGEEAATPEQLKALLVPF
jgi:putative SOS response-associated peptidase YedK